MEEFVWSEKYRPQTIEECILLPSIKQQFQEFVNNKNIPNLLLAGNSGVGKTTSAKAMCNEIDADYKVINGSLQGNIDTLRNDIMIFASSVSFKGGRKYVILDESDYLNPNSTQPALRNFMESFSKNCGFIFTCNYPNKIIKELHSRCSVIEFKYDKQAKLILAQQMIKRIKDILQKENIGYDSIDTLMNLVLKHFPDFRKILNELQRYSSIGTIDSGILSNFSQENIKNLLKNLKDKNFNEVRKWVGENNIETTFFRQFYDVASSYVISTSIPQMILILGEYQYKAAFVADPELNLMACFVELMAELEWK